MLEWQRGILCVFVFLAKEFSSNNQGDGPLMCEIRYFRHKYTPKHRRLSTKILKREAKTALDEPPSSENEFSILLISRMLNR